MNRQSIRLLSKCALTSSLSCNRFITFADALKVLALSDMIKDGVPLLAANLRKQRKNVVAVRSAAKSKWTARVTQQVNNAK